MESPVVAAGAMAVLSSRWVYMGRAARRNQPHKETIYRITQIVAVCQNLKGDTLTVSYFGHRWRTQAVQARLGWASQTHSVPSQRSHFGVIAVAPHAFSD